MSDIKHKAVFLDRDNTLIEDPGYISNPAQVKLLPGTAASLTQLRKMDFKTIVVSNQSGVARGIFTEEALAQIHHQLEKLLADEGAYLDAIYYCPFHPDGTVAKYKMESPLRKPSPGMILKAAQEHSIDLSESWMIGDSYRDIEAGKRAGCKTILINNPVKPVLKNLLDPEPDRQAVNIREAINIIRMHALRQSVKTTVEHKQSEPAAQTPEPVVQKPAVPAAAPALEKPKTPDIQKPAQVLSPDIKDKMKPAEPVKTEKPAQTPAPAPAVTAQSAVETKTPAQPQAAKPAEIKKSADPVKPLPTAVEDSHLSSKTETVLHELVSHLKTAHRVKQYEEFTLTKVAAAAAQVLAITCLIVSLWHFIDSTHSESWALMMIGYAAVLQLMAVSFYMMRER
jgi:D-glycero-D-manno-heptose 1,7-bisphosphate phosphatase